MVKSCLGTFMKYLENLSGFQMKTFNHKHTYEKAKKKKFSIT